MPYNTCIQSKHWGVDYFGNEILIGDAVFTDPQTGEIILQEKLLDYLMEVKGFNFQKAQ